LSITSRMRRTRRYSLQIKDAQGSIVLAAVAVWDGHDRRAAVAKILRLDGVLEAPAFPSLRSGEDVATNLERMAASFTTSAKKKPRALRPGRFVDRGRLDHRRAKNTSATTRAAVPGTRQRRGSVATTHATIKWADQPRVVIQLSLAAFPPI
jgi:hypothetical protein